MLLENKIRRLFIAVIRHLHLEAATVLAETRKVMGLRSRFGIVNVFTVLLASITLAQSIEPHETLSANDLVRSVVANELRFQGDEHNSWMYRVEREAQGTTTVKEVIQTSRGSLERLLAINGRVLNLREQWSETERLARFLRSTAEQQKVEQTRQKDAEQCRTFFRMIPDALSFSYVGTDGDLIKLSYRPNPAFQPPTMEARVFHEMVGDMWVHRSQRRFVRIRGQLVGDVKFAGGLLGHLEKGGSFAVEQREVSPGEWDITSMEVDMKGKALFLKTIAVKQNEHRIEFVAVPQNLTFAEAADMLNDKILLVAKQ